MKKTSRQRRPSLLLFALAILLSVLPPLQAAFDDSGFGARPAGMGQAFTAIADDSNAPLYNPAGIVQVQWNEATAMYSDLFSGLTLYSGNAQTGSDQVSLNQSYLAYVSKPTRLGSFGVSWANFNTTHLYREDSVALTYARNLGDFFPVLDNELSLGANLKYLRRGFTLDAQTVNDPVFNGGSTSSAMTGDVGILYKPDGVFWKVGAWG